MFTTIRKVLVANRGEIAVRILRSCAELGIATVAVYSEADRNSLHVRYADEAYLIGPAPARDSYLRIDRIIEVARRSGADAIHPGYGFLAENPALSRACQDANIVFVGPSPETLSAVGDKLAARQLAHGLGIPVVPGCFAGVNSAAEAALVAKQVGYPVMLKAHNGGGGKGMRVVHQVEDMPSAFRMATAEAMSAFGDDRIYIEKLLEGVRHIEVQILGDSHGNLVHLGERECSIQRRHQKLVEEAPSAAIDADQRQTIGEIAIRIARAINYESAGTVEFLIDRDKNFYFLEINARLQVEHPITEMVTGVDIVTEQLRIAAGRRLRYRQCDIGLKGWAIECRICAEDPYNGFLPSIGRITSVYEPSGPGVRVDGAVYDGCDVSLHYDSLLAKLIVWGETRGQAILRMRRALAELKVLGIKTNVPFFLRLMDSPSFIAKRFDTAFLDRQPVLERSEQNGSQQIAAIAAAAVAYHNRREAINRSAAYHRDDTSPWKIIARREALRR